jgi:hypothetical protein
MNEQMTMLAMAACALAGLAIFLAAALKGWHGWLELKRLELGGGQSAARPAYGGAGERIEIADLRERIRNLESIAACIDL